MNLPAGAYPDDEISHQFAQADSIEKRRRELAIWFKTFLDYCEEEGGIRLELDESLVDRINSQYWELMHDQVRCRIQAVNGVEPRADRHKIASLTELLIVCCAPIKHPDKAIANDLNARAAFFVATHIIGNWGKVDIGDLQVSESFTREHLAWLTQLPKYQEGWPIFSNAATWYLVELTLIERQLREKLSLIDAKSVFV